MPGPYAVRVRTADGWQDIALVGPPGPQGAQGIQGVPGWGTPFRVGHTFSLLGDLTTITQLPSFFVPKQSNQNVNLIGIRHKIASGTSVGLQLKRNGSNLGSIITVTPTATTTAIGPTALADLDEFTAVLSSPVGTPANLGATLLLEWSLT